MSSTRRPFLRTGRIQQSSARSRARGPSIRAAAELALTFGLAVAGVGAAASPATAQVFGGGEMVDDYTALTNNRVDVANLNPEPFTGMVFDPQVRLWAVNPYGNTVVRYDGFTSQPALTVPTGLHPVSVAYWFEDVDEDEEDDEDELRILVACTGVDHDRDGLYNGDELALGTDPWDHFVGVEGVELDRRRDVARAAPWICSPHTDSNEETILEFDLPELESGDEVLVSVMGVVTPVDAEDDDGPYLERSLQELQPLLLEDSQSTSFTVP
jgi:hypothetical protein